MVTHVLGPVDHLLVVGVDERSGETRKGGHRGSAHRQVTAFIALDRQLAHRGKQLSQPIVQIGRRFFAMNLELQRFDRRQRHHGRLFGIAHLQPLGGDVQFECGEAVQVVQLDGNRCKWQLRMFGNMDKKWWLGFVLYKVK